MFVVFDLLADHSRSRMDWPYWQRRSRLDKFNFASDYPRQAPIALRECPPTGTACPKGHEFEAIHGMGAPPPSACEICGAAPVSRVFYPISTSFTGSGFYSTDYGQGEQKPETATPEGDSAKPSDERAKKTDENTTPKQKQKPKPE